MQGADECSNTYLEATRRLKAFQSHCKHQRNGKSRRGNGKKMTESLSDAWNRAEELTVRHGKRGKHGATTSATNAKHGISAIRILS